MRSRGQSHWLALLIVASFAPTAASSREQRTPDNAPRRLKALYEARAKEAQRARLGGNWTEFREAMRIRQAGTMTPRARSSPGFVAIAAPVFNRKNEVLGAVMVGIFRIAHGDHRCESRDVTAERRGEAHIDGHYSRAARRTR